MLAIFSDFLPIMFIVIVARCNYRYFGSPCNVLFAGFVEHRSGDIVINSGGICTAPSVCEFCNDGYYPVKSFDGYCTGEIYLPL